jgi:hypothetical protein
MRDDLAGAQACIVWVLAMIAVYAAIALIVAC